MRPPYTLSANHCMAGRLPADEISGEEGVRSSRQPDDLPSPTVRRFDRPQNQDKSKGLEPALGLLLFFLGFRVDPVGGTDRAERPCRSPRPRPGIFGHPGDRVHGRINRHGRRGGQVWWTRARRLVTELSDSEVVASAPQKRSGCDREVIEAGSGWRIRPANSPRFYGPRFPRKPPEYGNGPLSESPPPRPPLHPAPPSRRGDLSVDTIPRPSQLDAFSAVSCTLCADGTVECHPS